MQASAAVTAPTRFPPRPLTFLLTAFAVVVSGCSTMRAPMERQGIAAAGVDPIEPVNRVIFFVNEKIDKAILKPLAQGYEFVVPTPIRSCITNAFANVSDVPISLNNFLQGKVKEGGSDICRVGVNTTVGALGCFDVASAWGFDKHNEDFGQTLGRWGVPAGAYVVLPLFGPSTVRDATALLVDSYLDPLVRVRDVPPRNTAYGVRVVETREHALNATNMIDDAALDRYTFVRDGYLTRRRSLVSDGEVSVDGATPAGVPAPAGDQPVERRKVPD